MVSEVKAVSGRGIPLVGDDIDTDRIIPARFLRCVTFDGLGEHVFADDRAALKGEHAFDQVQYQGAKILVVNRNFGCGSSREHAPQAIAKWGIQALVGESFAEIFFGNCVAMGIPCVTADSTTVKQLQEFIATNPQVSVTVNLETMQVQFGDFSAPISMGEAAKNMFVSGSWDACGQLVAHADQIRATAAKLPYLSWSKVAAS
ncbi:3-isopropylmalate dehydratase small subunit [Fischerella thermalis]|jgi:3-isopropylmalate/(R)-2-methylmalate dehydratase small subunit|uniref:3-isopropylmalate dehydratase small subunit n=1 Tax=Fischerella thermalis JSC-11 TaxID=741277 RepID=G6FWS7_9CYAN|nr:3-isopropylmalate dehydratase small subunit [Fischerella thermalis]PMB01781.1 3-isopropylmalate dehydratase small subunit [Fischerella thermalis CCMEE 5328]PMB07553.1 3-isopropylmalate dehydratase small subunit [Fischerella thermalis CCMEE 5273]EHC11092.1 3-isopropylmalate dehydratase, small subunit [Fischerella thermalis JSC-11]PLZ07750.1 3-isopropylmalate dehydratase small subunit [Fischerella thermalis WC119]PLZ09220.1 3-isopropylmalate dehydratase small subunit [Fischerella thermalis WC